MLNSITQHKIAFIYLMTLMLHNLKALAMICAIYAHMFHVVKAFMLINTKIQTSSFVKGNCSCCHYDVVLEII